MNKVFKVIWNHATQTWTAVSELGHAKGKTKSKKIVKLTALAGAVVTALGVSQMAQAGTDLGNSAVNITPNGTYNGSNHDVGKNSVVVGYQNTATTQSGIDGKIIYGANNTANATSTLAVGNNNLATAGAATALGVSNNASGEASVAIGNLSNATMIRAVAIGNNANAKNVNATAIGDRANALGQDTVAIASRTAATSHLAIAIGKQAASNSGLKPGVDRENNQDKESSTIAIGAFAEVAPEAQSVYAGSQGSNSQAGTALAAVAVGEKARSTRDGAVAVGSKAHAYGDNSVAIGSFARPNTGATNVNSIAIGSSSKSDGFSSVAIGGGSQATHDQAIAVGRTAKATKEDATAIGYNAAASNNNATAIGREATASTKDSVALGSGANTDLGFVRTDNATVGSVTYSGFAGNTSALNDGAGAVVSVGKAGSERQIKNVAAGQITKTSTDAINGSQLYTVANDLDDKINNRHWVVSGNTTVNAEQPKESNVYHKDVVEFQNGQGTTATVVNTPASKNSVGETVPAKTIVKYNANIVNGENTEVVYNADGSVKINAKVSGGTDTTAAVTTKTPDSLSITSNKEDNVTTYNVDVKTGDISTTTAGAATYNNTGNYGSHLTNVSTVTNIVNNVSWHLNSAAVPGTSGKLANGSDTQASNVRASNTVNINAGNNIEIKRNGNTIEISAADGVKGKDGRDGKNGTSAEGTVTRDEASKTSTIVIKNTDKDGNVTSTTATVKDGKDGATGATGANGTSAEGTVTRDEASKTSTIVIKNIDKDGNVTSTTATVKDGADGKNAKAEVKDNGNGTHTVTITDGEGKTTTTVVKDGATGAKGDTGADGKNAKADVKDNGDGTHTVTITDGEGKTTTTTVKDGATGANGKNAQAEVKDNKDGTHTVTITDGSGKQTVTTIKNGKDGRDGKDADGTFGLVDETGSSQGTITKKLNNTIQIKGDAGTKVKVYDKQTGKTVEKEVQNIFVKKDGDALKVSLNPDVTVNSVTTNELKAGPVTINQDGIDAGNKTIQNVAPGVKGTDAVNVNQLKGAVANIHNDMNKMDKKLSAGIAGAMSSGNLYHATLPGKSMVSVGTGTYRGETAVAVGYSRLSDNGKLGVKFAASTNSRGGAGASASVGYQW